MFFILPETKNIPLEELSAIFGDEDEVVLYSRDIVIDNNTHKLVLNTHTEGADLVRKITELYSAGDKEAETGPKANSSEVEIALI